jgi:hypothetical membrane protein
MWREEAVRTDKEQLLRLAGLLLAVAGIGVFMGIITAEALYPADYGTGASMISDLGGSEPPNGVVLEPSATIFNSVMIVGGGIILAGALCYWMAARRKVVAVPLALLGLGALGVGVFPGDTGAIHAVFAQLTFIAGGVAAILSALVVSSPLRYLAVVLGAVPLVNLALYIALQDDWFVSGLGPGGLERWIAYPIVLWLVVFGGYLMAQRDGALRSPRG